MKKAEQVNQYKTLADASEATGDYRYGHGATQIWYAKPQAQYYLGMGWDFAAESAPDKLPDPKHLVRTHVLVGVINDSNPSRVFGLMQGENWSPLGEARNLIRSLGLHHTSMSVGDIIKIRGGKTLMVDRRGFHEIEDNTGMYVLAVSGKQSGLGTSVSHPQSVRDHMYAMSDGMHGLGRDISQDPLLKGDISLVNRFKTVRQAVDLLWQEMRRYNWD